MRKLQLLNKSTNYQFKNINRKLTNINHKLASTNHKSVLESEFTHGNPIVMSRKYKRQNHTFLSKNSNL